MFVCKVQQKYCSVRKKVLCYYTDKKEKKIFFIYKEIQKSYMTNGLLIYGEIFAPSSYIRRPFLI
jgi:hypothetical protein